MLFANVPIMWLFGRQAMRAYHNYIERLDSGKMGPDHPSPSLKELINSRDVK
jgi:AGCS family alanine or glycine:cation symporter